MAKLAAADLAHVENLTTLAKAKSFLGREFLTWVWKLAEASKDQLQLRSGPDQPLRNARLWVDDRLVLEDLAGVGHVYTMKGGTPARSPESAAALAAGKSVTELKLGLEVEGVGTFTATLNGDDLSPRSLQLPILEEEADVSPEDVLDRRLGLIDEFVGMLDHLFTRFMNERTAESWNVSGLRDIKEWIRGRGEILQQLVH